MYFIMTERASASFPFFSPFLLLSDVQNFKDLRHSQMWFLEPETMEWNLDIRK